MPRKRTPMSQPPSGASKQQEGLLPPLQDPSASSQNGTSIRKGKSSTSHRGYGRSEVTETCNNQPHTRSRSRMLGVDTRIQREEHMDEVEINDVSKLVHRPPQCSASHSQGEGHRGYGRSEVTDTCNNLRQTRSRSRMITIDTRIQREEHMSEVEINDVSRLVPRPPQCRPSQNQRTRNSLAVRRNGRYVVPLNVSEERSSFPTKDTLSNASSDQKDYIFNGQCMDSLEVRQESPICKVYDMDYLNYDAELSSMVAPSMEKPSNHTSKDKPERSKYLKVPISSPSPTYKIYGMEYLDKDGTLSSTTDSSTGQQANSIIKDESDSNQYLKVKIPPLSPTIYNSKNRSRISPIYNNMCSKQRLETPSPICKLYGMENLDYDVEMALASQPPIKKADRAKYLKAPIPQPSTTSAVNNGCKKRSRNSPMSLEMDPPAACISPPSPMVAVSKKRSRYSPIYNDQCTTPSNERLETPSPICKIYGMENLDHDVETSSSAQPPIKRSDREKYLKASIPQPSTRPVLNNACKKQSRMSLEMDPPQARHPPAARVSPQEQINTSFCMDVSTLEPTQTSNLHESKVSPSPSLLHLDIRFVKPDKDPPKAPRRRPTYKSRGVAPPSLLNSESASVKKLRNKSKTAKGTTLPPIAHKGAKK